MLAEADIDSLDANGFTLDWTTAGGSRKWGAMASIPPGISRASKMVDWTQFKPKK